MSDYKSRKALLDTLQKGDLIRVGEMGDLIRVNEMNDNAIYLGRFTEPYVGPNAKIVIYGGRRMIERESSLQEIAGEYIRFLLGEKIEQCSTTLLLSGLVTIERIKAATQ